MKPTISGINREGISLRQWYVGMVLPGILANTKPWKLGDRVIDTASGYVELAFALADAAIKKGEK